MTMALFCAISRGETPVVPGTIPLSFENVCPRVFIDTDSGVSFSDNEKSLICGGGTWGTVPESQARYQIKICLQARGYHDPQFESRDVGLLVRPGPRQIARDIELVGETAGLTWRQLWTVTGQPLTPALLDSVESAAVVHLKANGYPCPTVVAEAVPATGLIRVKITPGEKLRLVRIEEDPESKFPRGLFRRYDAFHLNDPFDATGLLLTSERIIREGTLESHYFTVECTPEGAVARERLIAGPPRVFRLGFGLNTERFALLRVGWQNTRFGEKASLVDISGLLSKQEQELRALLTLRPFAPGSRAELRTLLSFRRQDETPFEELTGKVQVSPAYSWDSQTIGYRVSAGPSINFVHTIRGNTPGEKQFLTWEGEFKLLSHSLELTPKAPIEGIQAGVSVVAAEKATHSPFTARRIDLGGRLLWNVGGYRPSKMIVGLRGEVGTTFVPDPGDRAILATRFNHYLGGSANLRGFARNELPGGNGALSSIYLGAETRFPSLLPWKLEPLFFIDAGCFGTSALDLRAPVALSPGSGLRWESPIGTFRATAAHGYFVGGPGPVNPHFQFYFSFGEEF